MPRIPMVIPMWQTTDGESVRLYHGDVIDVSKRLPGKAVDCIVTSPPYWGLRDYGTNSSDEIGSEKTPEEYVAKMVLVFRELRRVLKDTGVLWLNLGDTYSGGGGGNYGSGKEANYSSGSSYATNATKGCSLDGGNLVGIPWRVALALQADGWMLRQDIIWHKPNPMPESVQNRCTKAHEYIFLLTKSMDYYYDNEAIREDIKESSGINMRAPKLGDHRADGNYDTVTAKDYDEIKGANKRSVWNIPSYSYPGAHYATFPPKLIEPCILAGTSEYGCCANCGDPYKRVTERRGNRTVNAEQLKRDRSAGNRNGKGESTLDGDIPDTVTVGWEKTCLCRDCDEVVPCTVLDPFSGAGTTQVVCIKHKRRCWGIELSKKYILLNQIPRIEGELLARPVLHHLIPKRV